MSVSLSERGEQSNLFLRIRKSQIRKFLGSFRYRKSANFLGVPIANPQIIIMINPQIANSQISTKFCTTLSQNSPKSGLLKRFFYFVQI
jgi:hypothetical protein